MNDNNRQKSNQPIFFMEKGKNYHVNPIYMMEEEINSRDKFVIISTTDGGKWVRGGMLYYNFNGVEVYTDINNAIFVDLKSNVMFIKEYEKVIEQLKPVDPEKRQYIILMYIDDDGGEYGEGCRWESMIGRTATYQWIRDNITAYNFDPNHSIVLTENVAYKDALSVS